MDEEYYLLMPFTDESGSFTHGFECGQIWELAKQGRPFDNYLFHSIDKEQVERILEFYGYDFRIEEFGDWATIFGTNKAELN